jgi:ATP phosphoribosyltransferase
MKRLLIGIPKGSLEESTIGLFAKAGIRLWGSERSLWLESNDAELKPVLLRPQEIPRYVAMGNLDCGLAGWDWILENRVNGEVKLLTDLCYSKRSFRPIRWVLAVPEDSPIEEVGDLRNSEPPVQISTELRRVTEDWLSERGIIADVMFSWGATEAKAPFFADAIVECTETGSSLRANKLRIIETVAESTTRFFANKAVYREDEWKREKMDAISLLLASCLKAEGKDSIRFAAAADHAETLESLIPSDAQYTVCEGKGGEMLFEIIADRTSIKDIIPNLIRNEARKISVASVDMLYE